MSRYIKAILLIGLVGSVAVAAFVWLSPVWRERAELIRQRDALKAANDGLQREIDELRRRQRDFRNDPEYVELVAREEGLIRPSETVYDFK
ncbi:MAG: septum formation initiator family protein [Kiritimatiellae bacterium]|nr:septum formation initiator family protein [Kiritimatiellia bacterium]